MNKVSEKLLCCSIAPKPKTEALNILKVHISELRDLLHAANLVPCVEMSNVEEVEQHLRYIVVLVDDILVNREKNRCLDGETGAKTKQVNPKKLKMLNGLCSDSSNDPVIIFVAAC